ncbi:MAG: hypothetical protein R2730_03395 [Chitinophagales bacterium]
MKENDELIEITKFLMESIFNAKGLVIEDEIRKYENDEIKKIIGLVLEHYGGNISHEFLIHIRNIIFEYNINDWKEIVNSMEHNKPFGMDSIISFFHFHTNSIPNSIINLAKINSSICNYYNSTTNESQLMFNNLIYNRIGLTNKDKSKLMNYSC